LDIGDGGDASIQERTEMLGPCGVFTPNDLSPAGKYMVVAQRDHARDREWRPVQVAGAIIGILLFLLLCGESFFLNIWSKQAPSLNHPGIMAGQSSREIIQQYNESLDLILQETHRPSSWKTMMDLAGCLPLNVRIKDMNLMVGETPNLALTCVIRAESMAKFRSSLSMLLKNIAKTFTNSPRLEKRDIELGEILPGQGYTDYPIQFAFRL